MTDGVLLRETLKDADLDKYRYVDNLCFPLVFDRTWDVPQMVKYGLPY